MVLAGDPRSGPTLGPLLADAGRRPCTRAPPNRGRDHPRGGGKQSLKASNRSSDLGPSRRCGEQDRLNVGHVQQMGPSPQVRGAAGYRATRRRAAGTIPAGAGSRHHLDSRRHCCGDHPRGRSPHRPARLPHPSCAARCSTTGHGALSELSGRGRPTWRSVPISSVSRLLTSEGARSHRPVIGVHIQSSPRRSALQGGAGMHEQDVPDGRYRHWLDLSQYRQTVVPAGAVQRL